jgi:hypothetical protein
MIAFIINISSKLKSLLNTLTSARAANFANLDAAISSRAPATTALSSSVWTNPKAGYLDAALSSRAAQATLNTINSNLNILDARANVKVSSRLSTIFGNTKIQTNTVLANSFSSGTGQDSSYVDVTISTVANTAKCLVFIQGSAINYTDSIAKYYPLAGRLTSTTNLRISVGLSYSGTWFLRCRYYVVELR